MRQGILRCAVSAVLLILAFYPALVSAEQAVIPRAIQSSFNLNDQHKEINQDRRCNWQEYACNISYAWPMPNSWNADFFNQRFSPSEVCTLKTIDIAFYQQFSSGEPGVEIYVWNAGTDFPSEVVTTIPVETITAWLPDYMSVDVYSLGLIFGSDFCIGCSPITYSPADTLCMISDEGSCGELRTSAQIAGIWETILDHFAMDVNFLIAAEMCLPEPCYATGDCDGDGLALTVQDVVFLVQYLTSGGPEPDPLYLADMNGDCHVDTADANLYTRYFQEGIGVFDPYGGYPVQTCCDCCETDILEPGDANGDAIVNITDAVYLIQYIFAGGPPPTPFVISSGDANCDCLANITDAVAIISYIFAGGLPPCEGGEWEIECSIVMECELVTFVAPKGATGCQTDVNADGTKNVHETFEMDATFKRFCQCCEYRQYVKGQFKLNGVAVAHVLEPGVLLNLNNFNEDGFGNVVPVGNNQHYGHRGEANNPVGDRYANPPKRDKGCSYDGWDSPGWYNLDPGDTYVIALDFRGDIIDVCNINSVVRRKNWAVNCAGVAKQEDYAISLSRAVVPDLVIAGRRAILTVDRHPGDIITVVASIADSEPIDASEVTVTVDGLTSIKSPPARILPQTVAVSTMSHAFYAFNYPAGSPKSLSVRLSFENELRQIEVEL